MTDFFKKCVRQDFDHRKEHLYNVTILLYQSKFFELIQYIRGKAQVSWKMQNNPYGRKGFNGKKVEALAEAFKF